MEQDDPFPSDNVAGGRGDPTPNDQDTRVDRPETVDVDLLGPVTVSVDGRTTPIGGRVGELAAYLALAAPETASAASAAAALWPDSDARQRRTNLRHAWFRLQEVVPNLGGAIRRDSVTGDFRWQVPVRVDVKAWLDSAAEASTPRHWSTVLEALPTGVDLPEWANAWREQVATTYRTLTHRVVHWRVTRGDFTGAASAYRMLAERGWAATADYCALLRVEAMAAPDLGAMSQPINLPAFPPTTAAIWASEQARLADLERMAPAGGPFVNRTREWERLEQARAATGSHTMVCVFIQGPAGIGKSALVRRWTRWLAIEGVPVLSGEAVSLPDGTDKSQGPGRDGMAPSSVVPRVEWAHYQAVVDALSQVTPPAVLLWEDLGAEDQRWDTLAYLLRGGRPRGLLVCVTMRDDGPSLRRRQRLMEALRGWRLCEVIALGPLGPQDAEVLVKRVCPDPLPETTREALVRWAAGSPLALMEGARRLSEGHALTAETIGMLVGHRRAAHPKDARRMVDAMSVLDLPMPRAFWRQVTGVPGAAIDAVIAAGFAQETASGTVGVAHAIIGASVRDALPVSVSRRWAARLAESLARGASDADAAVLAALYEQAEDSRNARCWWERVALKARQTLWLHDAEVAYDHLIRLDRGPQQVRWRLALADVLEPQGRRTEAETLYRELWMDGLARGDGPMTAQARAGLARQRMVRGDHGTAEGLLQENVTYYRAAGDERAVVQTLSELAEQATRQGAVGVARSRATQARALAEALGDDRLLADAEGRLGYIAWEEGAYQAAVDVWRQAEAHALAAGDALGSLRAMGDIGVALLDAGQLAPAVEYQWRKATLAHQYGLLEDLALALGNLGVAYQDVGQWSESLRCFGAASWLALAQDDVQVLAILTNNLAYTHGELGELPIAEKLWQSAVALAEAIPQPRSVGQFLLHWGDCLWEHGMTRRVSTLLRRAARVRSASPEWDRARWQALRVRYLRRERRLTEQHASERLLETWEACERPESRALLRYVLWEITDDDRDRRGAAEAVSAVLNQHPHHVWQRYLMRLTGECRPLPCLDAPPAWVDSFGDGSSGLEDTLLAFSDQFRQRGTGDRALTMAASDSFGAETPGGS
ncbi:MAG: AAA family ATPase [Clostridia bacterium]